MFTSLSKILSSGTDLSSKRVITAVAAFVVVIIALVDLFTDNVVTEYVFEGVVWIAMAGLGSIAAENFANRKQQQPDIPVQYQEQNQNINNSPEI